MLNSRYTGGTWPVSTGICLCVCAYVRACMRVWAHAHFDSRLSNVAAGLLSRRCCAGTIFYPCTTLVFYSLLRMLSCYNTIRIETDLISSTFQFTKLECKISYLFFMIQFSKVNKITFKHPVDYTNITWQHKRKRGRQNGWRRNLHMPWSPSADAVGADKVVPWQWCRKGTWMSCFVSVNEYNYGKAVSFQS